VLALRETFGRDLRMMGGMDKSILAKAPEDIDQEVARLTPLIREGGYIPLCDHHVPPDVSLANFQHYLKALRSL
jgi:uroporphyrinogen-III decarboxylase